MDLLLMCIYCFLGCMGYCLLVNVRGKVMILAPLGSVLCLLVYSLCAGLESPLFQCFIATVIASIYSEVMARKFKMPTSCFQIVSILPLVPGGGIYYTMEYCINGDIPLFIETGLSTLGTAGSIAVGILFVSSAVHIINKMQKTGKSSSI